MALDLLCGTLCMLLTSAIAFFSARRALQHATAWQRATAALGVVLLGAGYLAYGWDQLWLSRVLPTSALILVSNWLPIFASSLAGIVSRTVELPAWRRQVMASGMLSTGALSLMFPLIGGVNVCDQKWRDEICLQTTPFTCSAASAATLLNQHGIAATEAEMADLCLTNTLRQGTSWQGLYRGLTLKTHGTPWRVEATQTSSINIEALSDEPAILVACLQKDGQNINPIYRDACGWVPGQAHAVVFLGRLDHQTAIVGDPQFGRELWPEADLKALWTGLKFRLVQRN